MPPLNGMMFGSPFTPIGRYGSSRQWYHHVDGWQAHHLVCARLSSDASGVAISLTPSGELLTLEPAVDALECVVAPRLRDGLVCRAELLGRLDDARNLPLVLVNAPAGYGKTTLLAQWAARARRPFAWMNVDGRERGPAALAESILAAWEWSGIHPARGHGFVLVLDVGDAVRPDVVGGALLRVLAWLPEGAQVAVAARREPLLPLARMRGQRMVFEVGPGDLMMSDVEGTSLLRKAGLDLEYPVAQDLVRRTEGWPVMLELAAISLGGRSDPDGAARLAGDDYLIAEYLRSEIMSSMSRATARFLTQTSVLDVMSGSACDEVLGRTRSGALLARLARLNVPIRPLDRSHERYRVHGLLREMLQTELRRADPAAALVLHRRASDWHARSRDIDRAIGHARAAGDLKRTGELLWANLPHYVGAGRNGAVQAWLGDITAEPAAGSAPLALAAAHSHLVQGEIARAEQWARCAAVSRNGAGTGEGETEQAGVLMVEAWAARSGAAGMGRDAARAYALLPGDSPWRADCCFLRGTAALLTGDRDEADRQLEEGVARGMPASPQAAVLCLAQLGVLALEDRDYEAAGDLARRARKVIAGRDLGSYPTAALAYAVSAAAAVGEGRVDEAKLYATRCVALAGAIDEFVPWYRAETSILLARTSLALGDVPAARELLAEASRLARRTQDVVVFQRWFDEAWDQFDRRAETGLIGVASLTTAELRVLRFLPTHYAFHEIAERLHVSSNTVKTHVHAVYRKLDASSRSEAVVNATRAGLLGH